MEFWEEQLERIKLLIRDRIDNYVERYDIKSTWKEECINFLKNRGYVQTNFGFIKDFVIVKFIYDSIYICHDIPDAKYHIINKSHRSGLFLAINYYERL